MVLKILYKFRLYFACYCCNKRIHQQWNDTQSVIDNKSDNCPQIENTESCQKCQSLILVSNRYMFYTRSSPLYIIQSKRQISRNKTKIFHIYYYIGLGKG